MLVLFPAQPRKTHNRSFLNPAVFFSAGIISAATAQRIAGYPHISQFIKVDSYLTITRLSGFFGDPNFYSAHITACFAGIQILLTEEPLANPAVSACCNRCDVGLLRTAVGIEVICGCFGGPVFFVDHHSDGKTKSRLNELACVDRNCSCGLDHALIVVGAGAAADYGYAVFLRCELSQITTGRTELWKMYTRELLNNPVLLLTGEGYTHVTINGRASHNTILQGIFQFGLICFPVLIYWMVQMLKDVRKDRNKCCRLNTGTSYVLLAGPALCFRGLALTHFVFRSPTAFCIHYVMYKKQIS